VSDEVDQAVKVCVVPVAGETLEPADLAGWFARAIPYYASPRFVEVLEALPKNASGRVMKNQLRERPLTALVWDLDAMGLQVARTDRRGVGTVAR
jgi:crotonobetaine/carnitine-CoA ligase